LEVAAAPHRPRSAPSRIEAKRASVLAGNRRPAASEPGRRRARFQLTCPAPVRSQFIMIFAANRTDAGPSPIVESSSSCSPSSLARHFLVRSRRQQHQRQIWLSALVCAVVARCSPHDRNLTIRDGPARRRVQVAAAGAPSSSVRDAPAGRLSTRQRTDGRARRRRG
jgi:hypothetical protein